MTIIKYGKRLLNKCEKFATKRITGSAHLYKYRGESRQDKMIDDIKIGCLGEWAVYKHLQQLGYDPSEPDMKIYEKRRKSFDADIYCDEIEVHVKSQGVKSAKRYGNSWLVQRSDKLVSEPKDNQIFAFTNVNLETMKVTIIGYCWAKDMIYGECKVWSYQKTKKAIYIREIEDRLVEF